MLHIISQSPFQYIHYFAVAIPYIVSQAPFQYMQRLFCLAQLLPGILTGVVALEQAVVKWLIPANSPGVKVLLSQGLHGKEYMMAMLVSIETQSPLSLHAVSHSKDCARKYLRDSFSSPEVHAAFTCAPPHIHSHHS